MRRWRCNLCYRLGPAPRRVDCCGLSRHGGSCRENITLPRAGAAAQGQSVRAWVPPLVPLCSNAHCSGHRVFFHRKCTSIFGRLGVLGAVSPPHAHQPSQNNQTNAAMPWLNVLFLMSGGSAVQLDQAANSVGVGVGLLARKIRRRGREDCS